MAALLGSLGSSLDSDIHFVSLSISDKPETPIAQTASNFCIALKIEFKYMSLRLHHCFQQQLFQLNMICHKSMVQNGKSYFYCTSVFF